VIRTLEAIVKKPVVNERDEIEIGHRMSITLSGDHRVVDGAVAAEYMTALRKLLESPALLLL
jgi:pyruvate dehydrogenase E2 component (dihydrolipoamide acetyltransferase)